jgi:2-C-methyl-D-erythritol 4-phosphate cytidylyltransferase
MNSETPKQFISIAGLPVIMHTINAFIRFDNTIHVVVVLPEFYFSYWKELCREHHFSYPHILAKGGETRFHSVKNGLASVPDDNVVAIHDAVRPLVSQKTIEEGFRNVLRFGNAIPVIPVNESMRWREGMKNQPVNRENLVIIQTPQVFEASLIKRAYNRVSSESYTDDATVLEAMGETIHLYEGNRENIKITHPDDLLISEILLKQVMKPV